MSATEASLQILKCSLCNESLSVFPISLIVNLTTNISKNICGRCPTIEEEHDVIARNTMYEALAEQTLFPCRYKPNGCRERIIPAKLSKHEMYCALRPIFCPHTPLGSCAWQGSKRELLEHFNDKHRFLIIENCITEVDIVTKQQENYLMDFNQNLYIVQFECDGDDDALKVDIRIIGTENSRNRFQYYLSFYHIVGESSDTETNVVELFDIDQPQHNLSTCPSTCVVQISDLMIALNDPSTIRCRIVITPSQIVSLMNSFDEAAAASSNGDAPTFLEITNQKISEELQRKLECPVCLSHFKVPVLQCVKGHSLCEACRPASGNCPECMCEFAVTRNFTLEKILEATQFNCKNDDFGCRFAGVPAELAKHEGNCAYCRSCPLTGARNNSECPWMGGLVDILQHCRTVHSDNVLDLDLLMYYLPELGEEEHQTYLLHRYEQLFTLHFYCDAEGNCYWRVQWMGAALNGGAMKANYAYEVCLVQENAFKISIHKPIEPEFLPKDRLFAPEEVCGYIMIPQCQLQPFCVMEAIEYLIHICPV